jgi:two-component system response regulator HydG
LVVDDSASMVATVSRYLGKVGFTPEKATSGAQAIDLFAARRPDVVVTDLRMPEVDGLDVLEAMKRISRAVPVVIMTAFGAIDTAVDAMRRGAFDYLTKPFELGQLRLILERACRKPRFSPSRQLIGESPVMVQLRSLIAQLAAVERPVLILGETGTGKELIARAIHAEGPRAPAPFMPVNCASLVEAALDRELFGAPEAVPGDKTATPGLFRSADGGTLFLDEISDMSLPLQGKLLRVLEEGEVRSGGRSPEAVDVRCICATNQDLRALVAAGKFREDLFYRLDVLRVQAPPLRERTADIPTLIDHFLGLAVKRGVVRLQSDALRMLCQHGWPGNVRELENVVERLVVGARSANITPADVRTAIGWTRGRDRVQDLLRDSMTLARLEQRYVDAVLARENGNKTKAAEVLGVDVSTLYRRARRDADDQ